MVNRKLKAAMKSYYHHHQTKLLCPWDIMSQCSSCLYTHVSALPILHSYPTLFIHLSFFPGRNPSSLQWLLIQYFNFWNKDNHQTQILQKANRTFTHLISLLQASALVTTDNLHMSPYLSNNQKSKNVLCITTRVLNISEKLFHNSKSLLLPRHCQCCYTFC